MDFPQVVDELTFTPTERQLCQNVSTERDGDSENDEDFCLNLSQNMSQLESGVILEPNTTTVTILDDDGEL